MDHGHADRPTSGASAADLVAQLRETRLRTRRLTDDLSWPELLGPRLDIVNPVLWEIGHVGWFHEYWTLRQAHRRAPLIERGDRLWDSSNVPDVTRWQLDMPDRAGTFGYMADVMTVAGHRNVVRQLGPQRSLEQRLLELLEQALLTQQVFRLLVAGQQLVKMFWLDWHRESPSSGYPRIALTQSS